MLLILSDTIYHGRRAVAQFDPDRAAWAQRLTKQGYPPLAAWLVACKGWSAPLAKAYSLLGTDAGLIIERDTALADGKARKLIV